MFCECTLLTRIILHHFFNPVNSVCNLFLSSGQKFPPLEPLHFCPRAETKFRCPRVSAEPSRKITFTFFVSAPPIFLLEGEGNFSARQAAALRRLAAGQRRFRFLDL
jgi:hypothetical protein